MLKRKPIRNYEKCPEFRPKKRLAPHEIPAEVQPAEHNIIEAIRIVDQCKSVPIIQAYIDASPGPSSLLTVRGLLVGALTTALSTGEMKLSSVIRLMLAMPEHYRLELGYERAGAKVNGWMTYRCWRRIRDAVEVLNVPASSPEWADEGFRQYVVDELLQAAIPKKHCSTGTYALDATSIETWSAVRFHYDADGTKRQHTKDVDAAMGHLPAKNGRRSGTMHGYDGHLIVRVPDFRGKRVPGFIETMVVAPANSGAGETTLPLLKRLKESGQLNHVIVDRGYSKAVTADWAGPLRDLRIKTTIKLMDWQRNDVKPYNGKYKGFLAIDGWFFCPSLPKALREPPLFEQGMSFAEQLKLADIYEKRALYAVSLRRGMTPNSTSIQVVCPGRGDGKLRCGDCPASMRKSLKQPRVDSPYPEVDSCKLPYVTIDGDVGLRERQQYLYGTRKWVRSVGRRSIVEKTNGLIRVEYGHIGERGCVRLTGLTNNALILALAATAANVKIAREYDRTIVSDPAWWAVRDHWTERFDTPDDGPAS